MIRRALLTDAGQPFDSARAVESARALRAMSVFRDVRVDTLRVDRRLALRVETADGWSTKPQVGFTTAGGDATWNVGLVEQNLLGTATELDAVYRKTPDRRALEFQYRSPHFLWRRTAFFARYQRLSDGNGGSWGFGLPFYQTSAPGCCDFATGWCWTPQPSGGRCGSARRGAQRCTRRVVTTCGSGSGRSGGGKTSRP